MSESKMLSLFELDTQDKQSGTKMSNTHISRQLEQWIDPLAWILGKVPSKEDFELFEDVGQIYELQLAKMEYERFKHDLDIFRRRTA